MYPFSSDMSSFKEKKNTLQKNDFMCLLAYFLFVLYIECFTSFPVNSSLPKIVCILKNDLNVIILYERN